MAEACRPEERAPHAFELAVRGRLRASSQPDVADPQQEQVVLQEVVVPHA